MNINVNEVSKIAKNVFVQYVYSTGVHLSTLNAPINEKLIAAMLYAVSKGYEGRTG
jgi:hypothetical protein